MSAHAMPSADAAWLRMDRPTNLMIINSVLWFDEPIDWRRTRETFRRRVVDEFPRFSQRPASGPLGTPRWEDDPDFDIDLHFHRIALPPPHDKKALEELVSDLIAEPLDHAKPLWAVYLIEEYGSGCALFVRMHHSIADGIALARVMMLLTDEHPDARFAPPSSGQGARHGFDPLGTLSGAAGAIRSVSGAAFHEGLETLLHPGHAEVLAREAAGFAGTLAKLLLPGSEPATAVKGPQGVAHRVGWSRPVALSRIKSAGRPHGATVNDVLVAAVSGALASYLHDQGTPVPEVRAMVPFNLRPLDEPLPRELGNRFGLILLGLPVGSASPRQRLFDVQERMDAIKHSAEPALSYAILEAIGRTPARVEAKLIDFFSAKGSLVLTNVPGPRRPVFVAGSEMRGVLVWAPCSGSVGMSVSIFSYAGKVSVGFLTDAHLVPDPAKLARAFEDEVRQLHADLRPPSLS